MTRLGAGIATAMILTLLTAQSASAEIMSGWRITNNMGVPADDAELTFRGTGGTIGGPEVFNGADATILGGGNQVALFWTPALAPGDSTDFLFSTDGFPGIGFDSGQWTPSGLPVVGGVDKRFETSEPSAVLILLTMLAGVVAVRWRRGSSLG